MPKLSTGDYGDHRITVRPRGFTVPERLRSSAQVLIIARTDVENTGKNDPMHIGKLLIGIGLVCGVTGTLFITWDAQRGQKENEETFDFIAWI